MLSKNPVEYERSRGFIEVPSSSGGPRLFYVPETSQSDFELLFPWATKKLLKAEEPERTLLLNTRCVVLGDEENIQWWVPVAIH